MGYLDDEVKRLQSVIHSLENRVQALEGRQLGGPRKPTTEEIRMLLIGPPGAGTSSPPSRPPSSDDGAGAEPSFHETTELTSDRVSHRQGNTGAQDQGEVLVLPLGESIGLLPSFVAPQNPGSSLTCPPL